MKKSYSLKCGWGGTKKKESFGKQISTISDTTSEVTSCESIPSCSYRRCDETSTGPPTDQLVKQLANRDGYSSHFMLDQEPRLTSCNNLSHYHYNKSLSVHAEPESIIDWNGDRSPCDIYRTEDVLKQPSSSTNELQRMQKTLQPLHKCISEQCVQQISMHRTQSEIPVHTLKGCSPPLLLLKSQACMKHMEGFEAAKQFSLQPVAYAPVEKGDRLDQLNQLSISSKSNSSSSCMASVVNDVEEPPYSTPHKSYIDSFCSKRLPTDRIILQMEHVLSQLKKKMSPITYACSRTVFLSKLLPEEDIQCGYQNDRYIKIGSGEFGEVLYGRMKRSGQLIAIKSLKKEKTDMFALLQEALMLLIASNSGFTPKYLGLAPFSALGSKFQDWAIIMEYVGSNKSPMPFDFRQTLKQMKLLEQTLQLLLEWINTCLNIAYAVQQFHGLGILINDIKADNILLKPAANGYHPIFVDFGLASIGEGITLALEVNNSNRSKILKEYSHIAPEVLFGGETNTISDVFSLGKALSLVGDAFQFKPLLDIIGKCTLWNPEERPGVEELIESFKWLSSNLLQNHFYNN